MLGKDVTIFSGCSNQGTHWPSTCFSTSFITETVFVLQKSCSNKLHKIHMEAPVLESFF